MRQAHFFGGADISLCILIGWQWFQEARESGTKTQLQASEGARPQCQHTTPEAPEGVKGEKLAKKPEMRRDHCLPFPRDLKVAMEEERSELLGVSKRVDARANPH